MSDIRPFAGRHTYGRRPAVPEFLKRDTAGARQRLAALMERPEWQAFPLRAEFERALQGVLGTDTIDTPPDAA